MDSEHNYVQTRRQVQFEWVRYFFF